MRVLLARAPDDAACKLAVDVYMYQIRKAIGGLAAALGGLDTLVFSGGIGEHAAEVRARICEGLQFIGVELDSSRNSRHDPVVSTSHARVIVRVIPTDEEVMIATSTAALVL
jgi:acetate kinase